MKKTLAYIGIGLVVILAGILGYAATRPDSFRVQRTATTKAPPERVFSFINDFHRWTSWSSYEKLDPAMKRFYSGTDSGLGTVYEWEGNSEVGKGRMEITEASSATKIVIAMDFIAPFEAHNTAEFTLEATGDLTTVTWAMYGPSPYASKVMHTFFDMEQMIGKDFESGLANLKVVAEQQPARNKRPRAYNHRQFHSRWTTSHQEVVCRTSMVL